MPATSVRNDLARIMAQHPAALFETVEKEHGASLRAVVDALAARLGAA